MSLAQDYLRLVNPHADYVGGVRWSLTDNVLEFPDESCFAFPEQIADFLEGFASSRPVLHFALMMQLLVFLSRVPGKTDPERERLWRCYQTNGRISRNAGRFCAELCRGMPAGLGAEAIEEICRTLRGKEPTPHRSFKGPDDTWDPDLDEPPLEQPPYGPEEFEARIRDGLRRFRDEELHGWLRHGTGPAGAAAAALAKAFPVSLPGRLAALLERPRLAAGGAFLRQLSGALTLPPRRIFEQEMPMGGYADVATRGGVDQILPSQFALDDWDFFRRYSERELLYFRREEPNSQARPDLIILVDQGVRTWGEVRVVLGAALLAFGKQAAQRKVPFLIATTGANAIINPLEIQEDALGEMIEATDLSPHPGLALENVLDQPTHGPRDLVLLTHKRNLDEQEVRAAARRIRPGLRLFALTLDRHGLAALHEIRNGSPIPVREFHVDFSQGNLPEEPASAPEKSSARPWTGAVESIPYPFSFGIGGAIHGFDFDGSGQFLLTASGHGMLHLWKTDGTLVEVLPRGCVQGEVPTVLSMVVGVADGFAVLGQTLEGTPFLLHYRLDTRHCACYPIGAKGQPGWTWQHWKCEYSRAHHCLCVISLDERTGYVVDLGTGEKFATNLGGGLNRARQAWEEWEQRIIFPRWLRIVLPHAQEPSSPWACLHDQTGEVEVSAFHARGTHARLKFTPLSDGRPLLRGRTLSGAQRRGGTLALLTSGPGSQDGPRLGLFHLNGKLLGEYSMALNPQGFILSPDGRSLARQVNNSRLEISRVEGAITALGRTLLGKYAQELTFQLGEDFLVLSPGKTTFLLEWNQGVLRCQVNPKASREAIPGQMGGFPEFLMKDDRRWMQWTRCRLFAASDRYGQLALFDLQGHLVCMFFAFRGRLEGWLPDGTRLEQPANDHPQNTSVMKRFGQELQAAALRVSGGKA